MTDTSWKTGITLFAILLFAIAALLTLFNMHNMFTENNNNITTQALLNEGWIIEKTCSKYETTEEREYVDTLFRDCEWKCFTTENNNKWVKYLNIQLKSDNAIVRCDKKCIIREYSGYWYDAECINECLTYNLRKKIFFWNETKCVEWKEILCRYTKNAR